MTRESSAPSRSSSSRAPVAAPLHRPRRQLRPRPDRARQRAGRLRRRRGRGGEGRGRQAGGRRRQPPEDGDRRLDLRQLAALHRQEGPQGLQQGVRRQGQVRRGDQRQLRVLREGPPAAPVQEADRPRHRHADRLHGRALGAPRLRRSRSTRRTSRTSRTSSTTSRRSTTTPSASTRCRGSRARRASATTSRRPGASSRASRTSSTRSSRARSRCSPSPTTPPRPCCWATASTRRRPRSTSCSGAIEKIDKANQEGQFRRFTGNDYTQPLAKGDIWVALAYSGDMVQLQSDNPDLRFAYAEEGARSSRTT